MSRTNEAKHIKWCETCKCQCRLDASVYNNKKRWNHDKCKRQCKELIDNGRCNKVFIWNFSNCERDCDKLCNFGEYLDYKSCNSEKD